MQELSSGFVTTSTLTNDISSRLVRFKRDLATMECMQVVQKHILGGSCYVLNEDVHYQIRNVIATNFDLNPHDIFIVGSAKLGFSIAGSKRYQPFGDQSDIDVAIVSEKLFDEVWRKVFEYWESPGRDVFWRNEEDFKDYLFRGWIRPDKLPPARDFPYRTVWFEFFRSLAAKGMAGDYKMAAGIYKSLYFLEKYQSICARQCQETLSLEGEEDI